jgi:hypothetical protein
LDGWLGELGRKNLLLLAASPAKPAKPAELGELGDLGDWKPKTEIFFLSFEAGNNYQFFLLLLLFF